MIKFGLSQWHRLTKISLYFTVALLTVSLILYALRNNIDFFFTPSTLPPNLPSTQKIKIGGLVTLGSIKRQGLNVSFIVQDEFRAIAIDYNGILPDLFKEGQGVVVTGYSQEGKIVACQILAKHDENYAPPAGFINGVKDAS